MSWGRAGGIVAGIPGGIARGSPRDEAAGTPGEVTADLSACVTATSRTILPHRVPGAPPRGDASRTRGMPGHTRPVAPTPLPRGRFARWLGGAGQALVHSY